MAFVRHLRGIALLQSRLVGPASVMVLITGTMMLFDFGDMAAVPTWLAGMMGIFGFQFLLGVTTVRMHQARVFELAKRAAGDRRTADELVCEGRNLYHTILRALDVSLLLAAIYFGVAKPANPLEVAAVLSGAVTAALVVTFLQGAPSPLPLQGEEPDDFQA